MVNTIPGTIPYPPAVSGTWTAQPVVNTLAAKISVDGNKVVLESECTFNFTGVDSGGNPVTGSETVTLSASPTVLTDNSNDILRLGDIAVGTYGNTINIIAGQTKLRTA